MKEFSRMNCQQVRSHSSLFFDSEGDAEIHFGIEQHLESCDQCRHWFDGQARIEHDLSQVICQSAPSNQSLVDWDQLLSDSGVARAVETSAPRRRLTRPLLTLISLAASILLVVVFWSLRSGSSDTIPSLFQESISVHRFIASGSLRPDFESKSDVEVDRYLVSKASFPVRCPPRLDSGFEVHGAGMHRIEGRSMAYVVGHVDSQPISIFVLPKDYLQLIPRENQPESERQAQLQTTPEWLVAYAVVDQNLVLVVGNAPREKLEKVLSSYGTYPHES